MEWEKDAPFALVERRGGGIAYLDETLADRDRNGVLWFRTPFRPGQGRPEFGRVHPLRQRRTMLRLLCQVCAGPADRTDDGVLWLLQDHRDDWPSWPDGMGVTEPPICLPCVRTSVRLCPSAEEGRCASVSGASRSLGCTESSTQAPGRSRSARRPCRSTTPPSGGSAP